MVSPQFSFSFIYFMDVSDTEDKNTQALIDSALFWNCALFLMR